MWTKVDFFLIRMDRARGARSGTTFGIVLHAKESNPFGYYWGFWVIWVGLGDFRDDEVD